MFRAFNITDVNWPTDFLDAGKTATDENRKLIRDALEPFMIGKIVDGSKLADHWFPQIGADVFISHAHADEEQALRCAGWLKTKLGIRPFMDSCVWGHGNTLLKMIDDKYCLNPGGETYNYEKRNYSISHVHMMVATALSKMIDSTECVFFVKTENSITSEEAVAKTKSPWLFLELAAMRIVRRRKPMRRMRLQMENFSRGMIKASDYYLAEYEVPLTELTELTSDQLNKWLKSYEAASQKPENSLDLLYELAPDKTAY
jgi:hypothetical protein